MAILMNLYEQRFEATTREGLELVCVVLLQGAARCFHFVKNEANKMEAGKNNAPISSQFIV